jgi:hypothetical protein
VAHESLWHSPNFTISAGASELELLALLWDMEPDELRGLLRAEIQRRRREVGDSWKKLDETLDGRERRNGPPVSHHDVADNGDDPEAPPVHHQQRI